MACPAGTVRFAFDGTNPEAVAWIRAHAAELVTAVTAETQAAIRAVIARSFEEGIAPRDAAKLIRSLVGLTERDALAVVNARGRWLGAGVAPDVAARRAEKYAGKLHRARALLIARTETINSSVAGQQELWRQAVEAGSLRRTMHKVWIVADDERLCDRCAPLEGAHTPILEPFKETGTMGPTLHPACRCCTGLIDDPNLPRP